MKNLDNLHQKLRYNLPILADLGPVTLAEDGLLDTGVGDWPDADLLAVVLHSRRLDLGDDVLLLVLGILLLRSLVLGLLLLCVLDLFLLLPNLGDGEDPAEALLGV